MIVMSQNKACLFYFGTGCFIYADPSNNSIIGSSPGGYCTMRLGEYKSPSGTSRVIEDIMMSEMTDSFYYMPKEEEDVIK